MVAELVDKAPLRNLLPGPASVAAARHNNTSPVVINIGCLTSSSVMTNKGRLLNTGRLLHTGRLLLAAAITTSKLFLVLLGGRARRVASIKLLSYTYKYTYTHPLIHIHIHIPT